MFNYAQYKTRHRFFANKAIDKGQNVIVIATQENFTTDDDDGQSIKTLRLVWAINTIQ